MEAQDGTRMTLWSATQGMFLSTVCGGGSDVMANQGEAKDSETLRFVGLGNNGGLVAVQTSPGQAGEFQIVRNAGLAWIKAPNGRFLQKSLLGIALLNKPSEQVHIDTLKKYYKDGYNIVRNQVKRDDTYVIMEGRLTGGGDSEMADFAGQFRN
ncbi:hypothetical protein ZWY2020_034489 [Hordeum vulgare]|nr:hypothetical protein ZWY2020_034489 [Hordeum vulgare]